MTATSLIRSFGARIERLNEEIKSLNADKSEVYSEAKAMGLDQKALKLAVKAKADLEKNPEAVRELEFNVDAYLSALMGGDEETGTPLATRARARAAPSHDPDTGEITEPQAALVPAHDGAAAALGTSSSGDEPDRKAGLAAAASPSPDHIAEPGKMVADDLELPDFLRRKKEVA